MEELFLAYDGDVTGEQSQFNKDDDWLKLSISTVTQLNKNSKSYWDDVCEETHKWHLYCIRKFPESLNKAKTEFTLLCKSHLGKSEAFVQEQLRNWITKQIIGLIVPTVENQFSVNSFPGIRQIITDRLEVKSLLNVNSPISQRSLRHLCPLPNDALYNQRIQQLREIIHCILQYKELRTMIGKDTVQKGYEKWQQQQQQQEDHSSSPSSLSRKRKEPDQTSNSSSSDEDNNNNHHHSSTTMTSTRREEFIHPDEVPVFELRAEYARLYRSYMNLKLSVVSYVGQQQQQ